HSLGRNLLQPRQKRIRLRMLVRNGLQRVLRQQVVIAVVTQRRRPLRRVLQPRLVVLLEQPILLRHTVTHRRDLCQNNRTHDQQGNAKQEISHTPEPSSTPSTHPQNSPRSRASAHLTVVCKPLKTRRSRAPNISAPRQPRVKWAQPTSSGEPYPDTSPPRSRALPRRPAQPLPLLEDPLRRPHLPRRLPLERLRHRPARPLLRRDGHPRLLRHPSLPA